MATKSKKATYKGAALVRVHDKSGNVLGYVAKPSKPLNEDGTVKVWHQITCDNRGHWHCTCEGNATFNRECMHIVAAKELCAIRVKQGRPGCYAASLPTVVALPLTKEIAALAAFAASIPAASPKRDRATAPLQARAFPGLPLSYAELAARKQSA